MVSTNMVDAQTYGTVALPSELLMPWSTWCPEFVYGTNFVVISGTERIHTV